MNWNGKFKMGLMFGVGMSIFFIIQGLLSYGHLSVINIVKSIVGGLLGGAISGLLYGAIMGLIANSKSLAKATHIETDIGENVLFESSANHFKGIEGVGGKLYLTNKRLIFKSHNFNFNNHRLDIPIQDIKKADRYKAAGLFNKVLSITTHNDKIEKFVVEHAKDWMKHF